MSMRNGLTTDLLSAISDSSPVRGRQHTVLQDNNWIEFYPIDNALIPHPHFSMSNKALS